MGITVLDPTPGTRTATPDADLLPRPVSVEGLVVALLDNGKANSDLFMSALSQEATARGAAATEVRRKRHVGRLAEPELLAELAQGSDLLVSGVGDCAGCCSCSTLDGLAAEQLGTPSVIVCTTEFLTTARTSALTAGVADYPFLVIDHPFGSLGPDQVASRAGQVALSLWGPA